MGTVSNTTLDAEKEKLSQIQGRQEDLISDKNAIVEIQTATEGYRDEAAAFADQTEQAVTRAGVYAETAETKAAEATAQAEIATSKAVELSESVAAAAASATAAADSASGVASIITGEVPSPYYNDSYFVNMWAPMRNDDIYIRRIYKFAYNTAPEVSGEGETSLPRYVELALATTGGTRVYKNKLWELFDTYVPDSIVCAPATDATPGVDPIIDHTLLGFWDRCNLIHDENGDLRITAVRGDSAFRTEGAVDVATYGPTIYFDVRDSLEVDSSGTPKYTEIIMSTAPHPELGLYVHPLCMRSDGTVAPYWAACTYHSVMADDNQLRSLPDKDRRHGLSYTAQMRDYYIPKGKGWGGSAHVDSLLQLFHLLKYGTKNSQAICAGVSKFSATASVKTVSTADYDTTNGETWVPAPTSWANYPYVDLGSGSEVGSAAAKDIAAAVGVLKTEVKTDYTKVWLDIDEPVKVTPGTTYIVNALPPTGVTDKVVGKYDGNPGENIYVASEASAVFSCGKHPYRIQGVETAVGWTQTLDALCVPIADDATRFVYAIAMPWQQRTATGNDTTDYGIQVIRDVGSGYGADFELLGHTEGTDGPLAAFPGPVRPGEGEPSSSTELGMCDTLSLGATSVTYLSIGWGLPTHGSSAGLFYGINEALVNYGWARSSRP